MSKENLEPERVELGDGSVLTLGELVGNGTFATVSRGLLGLEGGVRRRVAVKIFPAASREEAGSTWSALARTAARTACIEHPNVVRTYALGRWKEQPLVVSELVDGISLAELHDLYLSRQERLPLDLALFIAVEVAEGLAAAHAARDHEGEELGILHHALSAREVLFSWHGEVKVSDFELTIACAATSSVRSLSGVATRMTSMAPEVAQGEAADARSDVFSFGVLLRELLIGPRFPHGVTGAEAIKLAREGFVQPMTFQPRLSTELESLMSRALELDPGVRYPNASALVSDLRPVALAMGVGDGRYFLRRTLERELDPDDAITAPTFVPRVSGDDSELAG